MPKPKKMSPEELETLFEEWKNDSPEYKILVTLKGMKKELPTLTEISPDITEKWQAFLLEFIKIGPIFKIKGATFKTLMQEQLRTAFFGGVNKRDEPFTIDGYNLDFVNKEGPKNCRHVKNSFIECLKYLEDVENLDATTFQDWKKNKIIYKFKEFSKFFKEHIKKDKGHTESKKILEVVLAPLKKLMEANSKLLLVELSNKTEKKLEESYFCYKADVRNFAIAFQEVLQILHTNNKDKIRSCPNVYQIFKKLDYPNWHNNPIEFYFLKPLLDAFNTMRANLMKLYTMGFDFWKQPLVENSTFVENLVTLLDKDEVAEEMIGNILSKAQTNYVFDNLGVLYFSNAKENFLSQEKKIIERTIPQIIIFKSMCFINTIFQKKLDTVLKTNKPEKNGGTKIEGPKQASPHLRFELMNSKTPGKECTPQSLIPEGIVYSENVRLSDGTEVTLNFDDNLQEELEKMGRFFIWPDLLPKGQHQEFVKFSRTLKNVNQAILNDIEDCIIVEGMKSSGEQYIQNRAEAIDKMNILNKFIKNEQKENIPEARPPFLWNEPSSLKEKHNIRFSSNLLLESADPKIARIFHHINTYAEEIKIHNLTKWKMTVDHVISAYQSLNEFTNGSHI
jgi:hypothetical protein